MVLEALAEAVEEVVIHPDEAVLAGAIRVRDRLDAKISAAVAEFDTGELWNLDGSASMAAWLRIHGGRTQREATRMSVTARKLRSLPGVREAWEAGTLSGGHVDAIVGIVTNRTLELFAENEAKVLEAIVGLGVDGRLVSLQLDELLGGVEEDRRLVIKDYFHEDAGWHLDEALEALADLGTEDLLDAKAVVAALNLRDRSLDLDEAMQPRGYRLLARIPRLPEPVIEAIVARFGNLQKIMRATIDDLDDVAGVGETRARAIKEGLSRLAETSILDRYA